MTHFSGREYREGEVSPQFEHMTNPEGGTLDLDGDLSVKMQQRTWSPSLR